MTKEQSQILKGIAVLFMVWGHIFGRHTDLYTDITTVFGKPLAQFLCGGMSPVPFFLILGGYGLYHVYLRGADNNRFGRILRLYTHYWIILALFVTIGSVLIHNPKYPGDIWNIILNSLGLRTSYNTECWFLLPYSIVSVTSIWLFKLYDKVRTRYLLLATFCLHFITCTLLSLYGERYINHNIWISLPICYLHFQFSFSIGAILRRDNVFDKAKRFITEKRIKTWHIILALLFSFLTICSVWNTVYFGLYAAFIIVTFTLLPLNNIGGKCLSFVGKHSMNIWMIHSYFCYHLFKDLTYSFKYPIVIFTFVVVSSIAVSFIVNFVASFLFKKK